MRPAGSRCGRKAGVRPMGLTPTVLFDFADAAGRFAARAEGRGQTHGSDPSSSVQRRGCARAVRVASGRPGSDPWGLTPAVRFDLADAPGRFALRAEGWGQTHGSD